jgi:choline dehydrogenase
VVTSFDVVVVGSGSSGGAAAARIVEESDAEVLLLEAGPDFPDEEVLPPLFSVSGGHRWIPAGIPELDWGYWDAPHPNGHRVRLARGRLVGGSSMVNGCVAVRGAPFDYDRWAAMGNPGWSWDDLLPYFVRVEDDADFGAAPYHGRGGPIHIRRYPERTWSPIHHAFHEGALELGLREHPDLNAPDGVAGVVGPWPSNRLNEVRLGTLTTYIRHARRRPNFTLRAGCLVDRVLVDRGRATGVRYVDPDGRVVEVRASTVILSAGVYGTPPVLQRSGIGPRALLDRHGIAQVADLPVGDHLTDHPNAAILVHAPALAENRGRIFLNNCRGPAGPDGEPVWQALAIPIDEVEGTAAIVLLVNRQDAEGHLAITSTDPSAAPHIDHRFNTEASDLRRFEAAWEFGRALLRTAPFRAAGAVDLTAHLSVEEIVATGVGTAQHPAGTCRMAPDGVVGPDLAVHGIEGLHVADASVFPDNLMNNINLTCYVIGEVVADRVLGRAAPVPTPAAAA